MNRTAPIKLGSDYALRELGPQDVSTFPATAVVAGTCTGRLFDNRKDAALSSSVGAGQNLEVGRTSPFVVGDTIYVMLDTLEWHDGGPLVSKTATLLVVTNAVPSNAMIGQRVARKLGADVSMPAFGTVFTPGTYKYGYAGKIAYNHADLVIGMSVRIETRIDAAAGQRLVQNYETQVIGGS